MFQLSLTDFLPLEFGKMASPLLWFPPVVGGGEQALVLGFFDRLGRIVGVAGQLVADQVEGPRTG